MANTKISALTALTGANALDTDIIPIVDLSEADASKNKKITVAELKKQGTVFSDLSGTAWDGSYKTKTLTSNTALTFSSTKRSGVLIVTQDGTGSRTLSINGTSVTINTAANSRTIITFLFDDVLADYVFAVETNLVGVTGGGGDVTAPVMSSITIENGDPNTIVITYNEALNTGSTPATGDFALLKNGVSHSIDSVNVSGTTVSLGMVVSAISSDVYVVSYTPGTNKIEDVAGNDAAALTTEAVDNNVSAGGYDSDAATYFAAVATAGVTLSTPEKDAYNTWVLAEKAASRYTKYTAIYPMMGGTAATHAINSKVPGTNNLTYHGSLTHNASGMRTAGTTADYAESALRPLDFGQDSAHISIYINDDNDTSGYDMGSFSANGFAIGRIDPDVYTSVNCAGQAQTAASVAGMNVVTRVLSTEYHYVKAGTVNTKTVASSGPSGSPFAIGLMGGLISGPSTRRYAFATIGSGLTSTEAQGLTTNTNTLQTSLSRA